MTAVNAANAPEPRLSDLLMGMTKLRGSEKLRNLLQYGPEGLTTRKIADAIRTSLREKKFPYAGRSEVVANAMDFLESGDDATVGGLRLLYRAFISGVHEQSRPVKVAFPDNAKVRTLDNAEDPTEISKDFIDISNGFREMFGFGRYEKRDLNELQRYQEQEFEKFVTAALGGIWDIEISKADGDQKGMIKVACEDRNNPWAQFEFFLDQANKQILWGDTLANSVRHGDPVLNQVSELLTTLVRRSVDCASDGNALQKAVLSFDKPLDKSRLDSLFIERVDEQSDRFEFVLQDAMGAQEEVERRLTEMFPGGFADLESIAAAKLGDSWGVGVSKVGGVDQGKVRVVVTDGSNSETQFEFILDQTNKRILCGGDFAKWAAKGDPRAKQMSELSIALAQSSRDIPSNDNASDVKALDRVEFKPGDVDIYALLKNGYGNSCKRARTLLIVQLVGQFAIHKTAFEEAMGGLKLEEDNGEKYFNTLDKMKERAKKIGNKLNRSLNKIQRSLDIDGETFMQLASLFSGRKDPRDNMEDAFVLISKTKPSDVMKIANRREMLSLEILRDSGDPELRSAAERLSKHYGTEIPLGLMLLELVSRRSGDGEPRNWVHWDAYETRKAPKVLPGAQEVRIVNRAPRVRE